MLYDKAEMWDSFVQTLSNAESKAITDEMGAMRTRTSAVTNRVIAEYVMFVQSGGETVMPMPETHRNGLVFTW